MVPSLQRGAQGRGCGFSDAGLLQGNEHLHREATGTTLWLLTSLAVTPLIAYVAPANVFIYLNLRYEVSAGTRE